MKLTRKLRGEAVGKFNFKFPVGNPTFPINNIVVYKGFAYVLKADGIYQIHHRTEYLNLLRNAPYTVKVFQPQEPYGMLGKYAEIKEGKIFFSLGHLDVILSLEEQPSTYTLTVEEG